MIFNWALYVNFADVSSGHDLRLLTSTGGVAAERSFLLPRSGTLAQDIHSVVGRNFIGLSFGRSLSVNARYGTELLRAFPTTTGSIGYIMRVPSYEIPLSSTAAYFRIETDQQSFNIKLNNPEKIAQARAILADPNRLDRHILGRVREAAVNGTSYNQSWSFELDPDSVEFFELSTEICDYPLTHIENEMRASGQVNLPSQIWCPWASKLVEELVY